MTSYSADVFWKHTFKMFVLSKH